MLVSHVRMNCQLPAFEFPTLKATTPPRPSIVRGRLNKTEFNCLVSFNISYTTIVRFHPLQHIQLSLFYHTSDFKRKKFIFFFFGGGGGVSGESRMYRGGSSVIVVSVNIFMSLTFC